MNYRKWRYEDIFRIAQLERECFSDPWSFQMLADTFFGENTLTAAAEEDGVLVGYAFAVCAGEEADLANIAVAKERRGKGVAKGLLSRLETDARAAGVRKLFLEVRVSNAPAMSLYLGAGYVGRYARPRYYGDGEDALVMDKNL